MHMRVHDVSMEEWRDESIDGCFDDITRDVVSSEPILRPLRILCAAFFYRISCSNHILVRAGIFLIFLCS